MSSVKEVDRQLAELEASPRLPEEEEYIQACLETCTEEEKANISERDILTCIRGYATYEPRKEETVKAFKAINEWREKVDYYNFFKARLPLDEEFYTYWEEKIYGEDQYGHPIVMISVKDIDVQKISEMDVEHMLRLQGQKQALYCKYKEKLTEKLGVQRYKYSVIIDLKGTGMNLLGGKRKQVLQKVFSVGADFFPESIWKIYTVNTPMLFRGVWAILKPWIHPITQAKVNMFGSESAAVKQMVADGVPMESLPEHMGGGAKPKSTFELLCATIEENSESTSAENQDEASSSSAAQGQAVATEQIGKLAVV